LAEFVVGQVEAYIAPASSDNRVCKDSRSHRLIVYCTTTLCHSWHAVMYTGIIKTHA